jgi:predicted lipase
MQEITKVMQEIIDEVKTEILNITNWDDLSFDWNKAYVASLISQIAYFHIPEYELKNVKRANLIPCERYKEMLRNSNRSNIQEIFRNNEIDEFFTVEKLYVIAVVVKIKDVLFISFRGTQNLYDWFTNLDISKSRLYPDIDNEIYFHKGFHRAVLSCMYEIYSKIPSRCPNVKYVYITGHSLGGALAAIFHAISKEHICHYYGYYGYSRFASRYIDDCNKSTKEAEELFKNSACYTFGMPRYGNFWAIQGCENPFHIYNQGDIVPAIPPKILGFDDSLIEYCLTSKKTIDVGNIKGFSFPQFICNLFQGKIVKEHSMENYIERIEKMKKVNNTSISP